MFFLTVIENAAVLQKDTLGDYFFENAGRSVVSRGFETNIKFIFKDHLKFFAGYTFTDARAKYLSGNQFLPLLPKNKVNLAIIYEKEKDIKIGLESYYTGRQYLTDRTVTPSYWEFGAMIEKTINKVSFYLNFENFTDTRQSNFKRVFHEPHNNPSFDEIWNHTEGFIASGGVKIKL